MLAARSRAQKRVKDKEKEVGEMEKSQQAAAMHIQKALVKGAYVNKKMRKDKDIDLPSVARSPALSGGSKRRGSTMQRSPNSRSPPRTSPLLVNAQVQTDEVKGLPPLAKLKQQTGPKGS